MVGCIPSVWQKIPNFDCYYRGYASLANRLNSTKTITMMTNNNNYIAPSVEVAEISIERGFEVSSPYTMDLEDYAMGEFIW